MRIPRLYISQPLAPGKDISLDAAMAHRLGRVLRLVAGAEVVLFDGQGGECRGRLVSLGRERALVKVEKHTETDRESSLHTHLGLALSRGERMDWAIQKAVETGVQEITPLSSEHAEVKIPQSRQQRHLARWQQIIVHACEQSGRTVLPTLHPPQRAGTVGCPSAGGLPIAAAPRRPPQPARPLPLLCSSQRPGRRVQQARAHAGTRLRLSRLVPGPASAAGGDGTDGSASSAAVPVG